MAIQLNYIDEFGENYSESYWRVININLNREKNNGYITFYGYEDVKHKGKRIIGEKTYPIDSVNYSKYFMTEPEDSTKAVNAVSSQSYKLAKESEEQFFKGGIDV